METTDQDKEKNERTNEPIAFNPSNRRWRELGSAQNQQGRKKQGGVLDAIEMRRSGLHQKERTRQGEK